MRSMLPLGAAAATLLLVTSGCVTPTDEAPDDTAEETAEPPENNEPTDESDDEPEVLASSIATSTDLGSELQIDIQALDRLENNLLRLQIGITNNSSESFRLGWGLAEQEDEQSASDISLIDDDNQQLYVSYDQSGGDCFCEALDGSIDGGDTETLWVMYPEPPADVESMTIITPLTPPMFDIPIGISSESVENENLADPEIIDLTMISDNLDDQTGRTEGSDEVSIILSSDVLFETNSSDLSSDAEEVLEQVAQELDDVTSETVSIDGHADNTGDDSVNVPLSEDRAESVESALDDLVTREGVTFESEGHGSADPIADNETEEGRERNRRVSVTFEV
ncbi:hypothetical protein GCM10028793_26680 [Nocardiopsis oceani]